MTDAVRATGVAALAGDLLARAGHLDLSFGGDFNHGIERVLADRGLTSAR